jgi:hypothetical protein
MLRQFALAYPSWSFKNHDMHLMTWDKTSDHHTIRPTTPVALDAIPHRFDFKTCLAQSYDITASAPSIMARVQFLWEKAYEAIVAYEEQTGRYDRIFLTRPDLYFPDDLDLEIPLASNEVGIAAGADVRGGTIIDTMFLVDRHNFEIFHTANTTYAPGDPHPAGYDFITNSGLRPREIDIRWCVVRPNVIGYPVSGNRDETFHVYAREGNKWWKKTSDNGGTGVH